MAGHIHPLGKSKTRKSLCIAAPACDERWSLPALVFFILLGHIYSWKHREPRACFTSALNSRTQHRPSPAPEWEHWLRSRHVHLHAGPSILFSLWFCFSGKQKLQLYPGETPAMLYSWDYLVVPNVTGIFSPASPKESKLPPDWTVWRWKLCFPFMAVHCLTLVTAGVLALPFTTTALQADFKLWSKKERKDAHYSGGDKQNAWHCYSSMSITIVHFCLRGSGVTYSVLLSLILCFSLL